MFSSVEQKCIENINRVDKAKFIFKWVIKFFSFQCIYVYMLKIMQIEKSLFLNDCETFNFRYWLISRKSI